MDDTIAAIATTVGISALNIIKVSGKDAINIVNSIFKGKNLNKVNSHTINYGFISDTKEEIDEVLVSVFKAPKSYTKENMIEINCHGGIITTNKILELLLNKGARLAEPGEFLKRAFLNGRIDLVEAESVSDLINAQTENARKMSIKGIKGEISSLVKELREQILSLIANIEVNIDYPEYEDAEIITTKLLKEKANLIKEKLESILKQSENGLIIKNGIKTVIAGKPNVGKSSILNKLINEDKAIVTDIAGTTRDVVEGKLFINGIELNLIDTAGIRESKDIVEKIGVEKSKKAIEEADLLLIVLDQSKELTKEDQEILKNAHKKKSIIILNKTDLESKIDKKSLKGFNIVATSTVEEKGLEELINKITEMFNLSEIEFGDYTYLSNSRQISIIKECLNIINLIEISLEKEDPIDLIEINIRALWDKLGEITGETYREELLDEIFSKFCLGK